ncbi:NAC domain-containing protein 26-like isoform X2 [Manihot esculenta]|nr:NAC domain-containing protein 26-like isoform X2 [Manihot esculenta]
MNNNSYSSYSSSGSPQFVPLNLPVGWRFHPSDEELVDHYLKRKRRGDPIDGLDIGEVQICDYDPKDLPDLSKNKSRDKVWYFFCLRLYHKNSGLAKRKAKAGYWKCTGDPRLVTAQDSDEEIGIKRTLVFHNPDATQWVIHEYEYTAALNSPVKGNYVLCKLKVKSNKKEKASKRSKKAEPDCKNTRPKKKARKCESDSNLTSASASRKKKLEEMTAYSAYGEGEPSNAMILDLENENPSMAANSTYNECETSSLMDSNFENPFYRKAIDSSRNTGETSGPMASYLENHSPNVMTAMSSYSGLEHEIPCEITSLSTNNQVETSCFKTYDFQNQCLNAFDKGKSSYHITLDFENQNPSKIWDLSASREGEQCPLPETPTDFEYRNQCLNAFDKGKCLNAFDKGKSSYPITLDFENQNPSKIWDLKASREGEQCPLPETPTDFEYRNQCLNAFDKGKSSYPITLDFEKQNPSKILDISASIDGEQCPLLETPSDFEYQNQYGKIDVSVHEDHQSPQVGSYAGETIFQGVQSQYKTNMPILEDCLGSLVASNYQEMYQGEQSQHNTEMTISKDNDALFRAFGVTKFPEIRTQLLDELITRFG